MAVSDPVRYCHFTFDFSQSVSLPHYGRQMGQIFFMTIRKVQIFGFRKSGDKQLNFQIDENETPGKDGKMTLGPNAVLSMIYWALETTSNPSWSFIIHADNCPGN
ncbi:hypothetical protein DPMN_057550 [Dreissena polymorpha]|uniref:Uncharacterized protein n=1 Tax=Dreissena polymorpha TaxID=45954 RepID=A0A9D4C061_DREPO|nr:hypothetical protein DPMN_057550 [Dreissena polymorpha]